MERLNHDDFVYQTVHTYYTHILKEKKNPSHTAKAKINTDGYNVYGVEILPKKTECIRCGASRFHSYRRYAPADSDY